MMAVAGGLTTMGAPEEAIELFEAAADAYEAAGNEANAVVARANLAESLIRLNRHAEARPLLEAVLAFRTERDGAEHEETLKTRAQLASCMGEMGDAEGAMREEEAVEEADVQESQRLRDEQEERRARALSRLQDAELYDEEEPGRCGGTREPKGGGKGLLGSSEHVLVHVGEWRREAGSWRADG